MDKAKHISLILILAFLIGTSEMHSISSITTIGEAKKSEVLNDKTESMRSLFKTIKEVYSGYLTKYDKDHTFENIVHLLSPSSKKDPSSQVLLQEETSVDEKKNGYISLFIASVVLLFANMIEFSRVEDINWSELKEKISTHFNNGIEKMKKGIESLKTKTENLKINKAGSISSMPTAKIETQELISSASKNADNELSQSSAKFTQKLSTISSTKEKETTFRHPTESSHKDKVITEIAEDAKKKISNIADSTKKSLTNFSAGVVGATNEVSSDHAQIVSEFSSKSTKIMSHVTEQAKSAITNESENAKNEIAKVVQASKGLEEEENDEIQNEIEIENEDDLPHEQKVKIFRFVRQQVSNFLYLVAAAFFLTGFMKLIDSNLNDQNGDIRLYGPLTLQLLSAVFFTIKPVLTILKFVSPKQAEEAESSAAAQSPQPFGVFKKWPNFFGILFFHLGNMIAFAFTCQNMTFSGPAFSSGYKFTNAYSGALLLLNLATAFLFAANETVVSATLTKPEAVMGYTFVGNLLLIAAFSILAYQPAV